MLGIVIANWNGEELIDKCLSSLVEQEYKEFRVYIIDNASKDNSIKVINSYKEQLQIVLTEFDHNSGFAVANNIGIKQAFEDGCNYVLTLNNDVEVPKESLKRAMEVVNKGEYDFYQLFMINYFDRNKCDAAGLTFQKNLIPIQVGFKETAEETLKKHIEIEGVCAGAAIYSRKSLEAVKLKDDNYFDSNFFAYFEDVDLSLRLISAGFKAKLIKDAIVYHMHSATGGKSNGFKEYYLTRNLFIYTKRNQSLEDLRKNNYSYYIRFMKTLIKSSANFNAFKSTLKGLRDGISERKKLEFKK